MSYFSGYKDIIFDSEDFFEDDEYDDYNDYYDPDERYKESNGFLPKNLKKL